MKRPGPKMLAAVAYVAAHPGCPKLAVAKHVGPNGSTRFGWQIVGRAIKAGLIDAELTDQPGKLRTTTRRLDRGPPAFDSRR